MAREVDVRRRGDGGVRGEALAETADRRVGPADHADCRPRDVRDHADASGCTPKVEGATPGDALSCASSGGSRIRARSRVTPSTTIAAESSWPMLNGPRTKLSCGAGCRVNSSRKRNAP